MANLEDDAQLNRRMDEWEDDIILNQWMDKFKEMAEEDVNKLLRETTDNVERQLAHQEQIGGSLASPEPCRFIFALNPCVDRHSERMGVRERHYTANLRQMGNFIPQQRLSAALQDDVYRALQNLIAHERIPDQDRVYFKLSSNRLTNVQLWLSRLICQQLVERE